MSAWMCSNAHLSGLATYAAQFDLSGGLDAPTLARVLYTENARSLEARYPGRNEGMIQPFAFERVELPSAMQVAKSAACYRYQSCEHDNWEQSFAAHTITAIIAHASDSASEAIQRGTAREPVWGWPGE